MAMDIQAPSVLAQMPRPLHASTGKTHIGEVYSLADSKKRKRYEVVVAVDGEAVNIYNVQTPKLVTSYAVPPQSTFSCRPCSVRRKVPGKSSVKRQTFGAVSRPEHQIKSFVEEIGSESTSAPLISSSSFTVADSKSPTVFVGIVPAVSAKEDGHSDPFDLLSVHQDGRIRRLASDLKTQRWNIQHSEIAKTASTHEVHTCFLVEFEDAKKALFKRRQDLAALALGDLTNSGVAEPSILLLVSHPIGSERIALKDVKVQVFSVPAAVPSEKRSLDDTQSLRHLLTVDIPDVESQKTLNSRGLQWNFHSGSAGLNLSFERGFVNFDLSQYSPTVTSQFILDDEHFSSVMRISPQSVIGAGQSLVALYDTQYQSVQRSISVADVPSSDGQTTFIGYFAKLGIAVATKGNTLLAFDLSTSHPPHGPSLKRPRDGLLIDAIGRGIGSSAAQWDAKSKKHRTEKVSSLGLNSVWQAEKWNDLTAELDDLTRAKDAEGFDRAVKDYFGAGDHKTLPKPGSTIPPETTLFLLSKIFSVKEITDTNDRLSASSSFRLCIEVWPKITTDWLIRLGHLSLCNVEIALRRAFKPRILPSLPTGSFVQALIETDPTLRRLLDVYQSPILMNAEELAYALRILLDMVRTRWSTTTSIEPKALTNGTTPTNNEDKAPLKTTFRALNTTLTHLHAHPPTTVTSSLRTALPSRPDLTSLIHHLRISLATGGYTSRFTENPPTPITPDQSRPPLSLSTIADLLSAAVDAVGPSGWISATVTGGVDDAREQGLVSDLKAEISAALAGVQEAAYLKGVLREYLRFGRSVAASSTTSIMPATATTTTAAATASRKTHEEENIRHEKLNGADLLVYTGDNDDEDGYLDGETRAAASKMLPLSLRAPDADVSRTKMKKSTGEIKNRSSREIGYLRRKAVGKYAFERLVV